MWVTGPGAVVESEKVEPMIESPKPVPQQKVGKSRLKQRAALLLLTRPTIREVAEELGIAQHTIYMWKRQPAFIAMIQQQQKDLMAQTTARLIGTSLSAVETLQAIASNVLSSETARVSSARSILEYALKVGPLAELSKRLQMLEVTSVGGEQDGL